MVIIKKQPFYKLFIYFILHYLLVFGYYFIVDNYQLFSVNSWLNSGTFFYVFFIGITFLLFINSKSLIKQFLLIDKNKILIAIRIFILSIIIISILEFFINGQNMLFVIYEEKPVLDVLKNLNHGVLAAFTEELSFKYILLLQLVIRIRLKKSKLILLYLAIGLLFTLSHIFVVIHKSGSIEFSDMIYFLFIFLFSFFTSILFIKKRNLFLVILLHFQVNIAAVFHNNEAYYLVLSTLLIGIYTIPEIQKSILFR